MSLKSIIFVYIEFNTLKNIGLKKQGKYFITTHIEKGVNPQLFFSFSDPVTMNNRAKGEVINLSHMNLEPSSIDIINSKFSTRKVCIQYKEEIASINEGCYFRIEIPLEELGKRSCDITFDLYLNETLHDPVDKRFLGFSNEATLISSQVLTITSVGVATTMSYLPLLYTENGFMEMRGLIISSLMEIRYQPDIEEGHIPTSFGEYMFGQATSKEELEGLYKEQKKSLFGCLKVSYESIKQYIIHIQNIASSLENVTIPIFKIPSLHHIPSMGNDKNDESRSSSCVNIKNASSTIGLERIDSTYPSTLPKKDSNSVHIHNAKSSLIFNESLSPVEEYERCLSESKEHSSHNYNHDIPYEEDADRYKDNENESSDDEYSNRSFSGDDKDVVSRSKEEDTSESQSKETSHIPSRYLHTSYQRMNPELRRSLEHMESDYDNDFTMVDASYRNNIGETKEECGESKEDESTQPSQLLFSHSSLSKTKNESDKNIPPLESLDFDSVLDHVDPSCQPYSVSSATPYDNRYTPSGDQEKTRPYASVTPSTDRYHFDDSSETPIGVTPYHNHQSNSSRTPSDSPYSPAEESQEKNSNKLRENIKRMNLVSASMAEPSHIEEKEEDERQRAGSFSVLDLKENKFNNEIESYGSKFCREITYGGTQVLDIWEQFISLVKANISLLVGELEYEYSEKLFDSLGYFIYTEHNDIHNICEEQRNVKEYHNDIIQKILNSALFSPNSPIYLNLYHVYAKDYDVINQQNICILIEQTYSDIMKKKKSTNGGQLNVDQLNSRFPLYDWKCPDVRCNTINPRHSRICKQCLNTINVNYFNHINAAYKNKMNYFNNNLHVVFFLHGLKGHASDMKILSQCFSYVYPHIIVYTCSSCENNTEKPIEYQAELLAKEVSEYLIKVRNNMNTTKHFQISFVGHSLGGLIIRYALTLPILQPYLGSLNFYLSISTPHFGILFSKHWYEMGAKMIAMFNSSASIEQLTVNNKDPSENIIFQMTIQNTLVHFKHIYFCSSSQDGYTPFHSVRAEYPVSTSNNSSRDLEVYQTMLNNFFKDLDASKITKFDFYYPYLENKFEDFFLRKAAHIELLKNVDAAFMLLIRLQNSFD